MLAKQQSIEQLSYPASSPSANRYFWWFISLHVLAWTLGPTLFRGSVTHDTLEGIAWGMQWQLGYNKHPFLTAWLCAGITQLFDTVGWPVYLLAQLIVATTFFAVWRLANKFLSNAQALVATLALEGILFYNLNTFNLTPDSMQSPLWALLGLFFYQALTTQTIKNWLLTGLIAALAIVTKYQIVLLFLPMLLLCLTNSQARQSFKQPGIYYGLAFMLILISPHLIWLYQHQFITISYAFNTPSEYTHHLSAWRHISYPLRYLANNIGNVIGLFILLWPFYLARQRNQLTTDPQTARGLNAFQWQFLGWLGFGPLALSLLLCVMSGDHFPPRWSTPYFFLLGIIIVAWLNPQITAKQLKQFLMTLLLVGGLLWLGRMSAFAAKPHSEKDIHSDSYLPNQQIAETLTQLWHQRYHQPLRYIAGSHYLVAAITAYSPDHPIPYFDFSRQESPWIDEAKFKQTGALVVWDQNKVYTWDADSAANALLTSTIRQRFPELEILGTYKFKRLTTVDMPLEVGVALLAPQARRQDSP